MIVNPPGEYKRALAAAASALPATHGDLQAVADLLLRPRRPHLPRAHLPVRLFARGVRTLRELYARGCGCGLAPVLRRRQVVAFGCFSLLTRTWFGAV